MKDLYTPYVRPDGIIVGIKGKAPEKEPFTGIPEVDSAIEDVHVEALTAFIQSGHAFEDQKWAQALLPDSPYDYKPGLLPPIELDVEEVWQERKRRFPNLDPFEWTDWTPPFKGMKPADHMTYEYRTVLRIAKEEHPKPRGTESERDFTEDYNQENGNYQNECCRCHKLFYGNKHRVVCKVCQPTEEAKLTPEQIKDREEAINWYKGKPEEATETQDELCTEMISKIQGMEFISAIDLVMEQFTIQRKPK